MCDRRCYLARITLAAWVVRLPCSLTARAHDTTRHARTHDDDEGLPRAGNQQLRIRHSQQPREAAWVGGSIIASLNHAWESTPPPSPPSSPPVGDLLLHHTTITDAFTQAFYEEEGPHAVHRFFY